MLWGAAVVLLGVLFLGPIVSAGARSEVVDKGLALAKKAGLPSDSVAFVVIDANGRVHESRGAVPLAPASNLKVVTAAAALHRLGEGASLDTELWIDGRIDGAGTLVGDVIVVGSGDPSLSSRFDDDPLGEVARWPGLLRELGIRRIQGDLIGDDRALAGDSRRPEWPADQLDRWYCAPSGALNLNDNCVDVVFRPAPASGRVDVFCRPESALWKVSGEVRTTAKKKQHKYWVERGDGYRIRVGGKFLASASEIGEPVTVVDPTVAFLAALRARLERDGIALGGEIRRGQAGERAWRLDRISHTVGSLVPVLLKRSQNLYGDCLLRVLGRATGGDGSFESGGKAVLGYLEELGVAEGCVIRDGSGLSRDNRLTARALAAVLEHAASAEWGPLLEASLPISGYDGTLRRRFRKSPARGRVRAKTGYIQGVTNLSGFLDREDRQITFALVYNGPQARIGAAKSWQQSFLEYLQNAPAVGSGR